MDFAKKRQPFESRIQRLLVNFCASGLNYLNINYQLMKSSYNRVQKPRPLHQTGNTSKKNSNISSIMYKQIGEALKGYTQRRSQKNSHCNITMEQEHENNQNMHNHKDTKTQKRKDSKVSNGSKGKTEHHLPFQQLTNNFMNQKSFIGKQTTKATVKSSEQNENPESSVVQKITKKSFDYKYIIGKGGFGKVWKIEHMKTRNQYAMKEMLKSLVMTKKSVQSVMNERTLLADLNSPFIVNMHYAFQDRDTLYLVLDLLEGGDLRHHISTKSFSEIQTKFFICCIILGLEYLHNNKIIHRDIKPENLVLDSRGYVRITDLGIARIKKTNNNCDTSGTPGYMSPEVICRQNHSYVSDYFALGVIAYEMATGKRPYNGFSRNEIREQILSKQVQAKPSEIPEDWSHDCLDFINKLLQRKPEQRLGHSGGASDLKNHPWIRDINWKKLAIKQIQSPFIPLMRKVDFDQDEQITIEDEEEAQIIQKNSLLLRKPEFQQLFKNYFYEPSSRSKTQKNSVTSSNQALPQKRRSSNGSHTPTASKLLNTTINKNPSISGSNSEMQTLKSTLGSGNRTPNSSFKNIGVGKKSDMSLKNSKDTILNTLDSHEGTVYGRSNRGYGVREGREKERAFFKHEQNKWQM